MRKRVSRGMGSASGFLRFHAPPSIHASKDDDVLWQAWEKQESECPSRVVAQLRNAVPDSFLWGRKIDDVLAYLSDELVQVNCNPIRVLQPRELS